MPSPGGPAVSNLAQLVNGNDAGVAQIGAGATCKQDDGTLGSKEFQSWLEREVRARLMDIEAKLDQALQQRTVSNRIFPWLPTGMQVQPQQHSRQPPLTAEEPIGQPADGNYEATEDDSSLGGRPVQQQIKRKATLEDVLTNLDLRTMSPKRQASNLSLGESNFSSYSPRQGVHFRPSDGTASMGSDGKRPSKRLNVWLKERTSHRVGRVAAGLDKVWEFMEDPDSSTAAMWFQKLAPLFILWSVVVTLVQACNTSIMHGVPAAVLETSIEAIFATEIMLRFISSPRKTVFFVSCFNLTDIVCCLPLALRASLGFVLSNVEEHTITFTILMGLVPVLRLIKVLRHFQKMFLLIRAFKLALEALPVMLFIYFAMFLVFTVLIYVLEQPGNIPTMPQAAWLTFVSMTTVGYGDVVAQTPAGRLATSLLVLFSALYMSIPLGIIGNAFSEVWSDRDRILLTRRTRNRLVQWGYNARDIPKLFELFDVNQDGELDIEEFVTMVDAMQVGLKTRRVMELFDLFDNDGSGAVDGKEFVKGLFPEAFHEIFGHEEPVTEEDLRMEIISKASSARGVSSEALGMACASPPRGHQGEEQAAFGGAGAGAGTEEEPGMEARSLARSH